MELEALSVTALLSVKFFVHNPEQTIDKAGAIVCVCVCRYTRNTHQTRVHTKLTYFPLYTTVDLVLL
jgi:hypothetical protein